MTASAGTAQDTAQDTAQGTTPAARAGGVRGKLRRHRFWLIAGVLLAAALLLSYAAGTGKGDARVLSPGNPGPDGAMAAAAILRSRGVDVQTSDNLDRTRALVRTKGAAAVTVLVADDLGYLHAAQVRELAGTGARLVLLAPGVQALSGAGAGISAAGVAPAGQTEAQAGCPAPDPQAAGSVSAGHGYLYRGPVACFASPSGSDGAPGSYAASADGSIVALGNVQVLQNARLDQLGNAALVLRTLGSRPTLVWYQPGLKDAQPAAGSASLPELMPQWVTPVSVWLLLAGVAAMLWRGRRTGPLVPEPLPVVVRAAETVEGRARLYQGARAVDRAAASLRAGALTRLCRHFRLDRSAPAEAVAAATAARTGRPDSEVARILLTERPATDSSLLRWAQELDTLEKEATRQ